MSCVRRPFSWLLLALLAVLAPSGAARAANVGVRYVVDAKALKGAVAGTQLTFALFSDSSCTNQIYTTDVAIEAVDRITALKLVRPKGAPKPTQADEIQQVLTGVAPAPEMYLTVTGTGVTPIGNACQAQAATGLAVWSHGNGLGNGSSLPAYTCTAGLGGPVAGAQLGDVVVVAHETMPEYIRVWADLVDQGGGQPPTITWHICNDSGGAVVVPGGVGATAYGLRP